MSSILTIGSVIKSKAQKLIDTYIEGWKMGDDEIVCRALTKDCLIIESHGPTYNGVGDVKKWVNRWIKEKHKVDKWDIISFLLKGNVAVFEWQFTFSSSGATPRTIDGMSIVKFTGNKIAYLREYRTTKPLYKFQMQYKSRL